MFLSVDLRHCYAYTTPCRLHCVICVIYSLDRCNSCKFELCTVIFQIEDVHQRRRSRAEFGLVICIKRIYHECEGRIETSVSRIVLSYLQTNNGFFFLLTTVFYFKISFQKSLNTLRFNFTWWRHFNITMTSLDDHVHEFQYNQHTESSRDSLGKIARVRL